jgi:heme/copper-type cytochrome/quinol oxidase subunit 2
MAKGPLILKISGIVMFLQALIGSFIVLFSGLSLISVLNFREALNEQLMSPLEYLGFAGLVLVLITSIALFICSLKSFNTYNRYLISGGNDQYLKPSRFVLIFGALTFLSGFTVSYTPYGSSGLTVLIMIVSAGWVLALLNLILVKKDREERAREEENEVKQPL